MLVTPSTASLAIKVARWADEQAIIVRAQILQAANNGLATFVERPIEDAINQGSRQVRVNFTYRPEIHVRYATLGLGGASTSTQCRRLLSLLVRSGLVDGQIFTLGDMTCVHYVISTREFTKQVMDILLASKK